MNTPTTNTASGAPAASANNSNSSNRTKYLRERREALRKKLGGQCVRCGTTAHLQFDCITSTGPEHHGMNWRGRLKFYEGEAERGNLQLLCPACHVTKTLDEIAARKFHNFVCVCPSCRFQFKVGHQMRMREPLPVASIGVDAPDYDAAEGSPIQPAKSPGLLGKFSHPPLPPARHPADSV